MADTQTQQQKTNGVSASRAATLAALQAGEDAAETASQAEAVEPSEVEAGEPAPTDVSDPADDDQVEGAPGGDEKKAAAATAAAKPNADEETEKRGLARVQAQAKRERDAIAKERAELEQRIADIEKKAAGTDRLSKLVARVESGDDVDIIEAMEAIGVKPERRAHVAKVLYANRPEAKPEEREAATQLQRSQATTTAAERALKELAELRAELKQRDEMSAYQQAWGGFFGDVAKGDTSEAPLFKAALTNDRAGTERTVREITQQYLTENGELPDVGDVIAHFEKNTRAQLKKFGLDPAAAKADEKKTGQKTTTQADEKKTGKTLSPDLSTSTPAVPRNAKSLEEHRAETLAMLESGKLE